MTGNPRWRTRISPGKIRKDQTKFWPLKSNQTRDPAPRHGTILVSVRLAEGDFRRRLDSDGRPEWNFRALISHMLMYSEFGTPPLWRNGSSATLARAGKWPGWTAISQQRLYCRPRYHKSFERARQTHPIISCAWRGDGRLAAAAAHLWLWHVACGLIVCLILSKNDSPCKATSTPGPLPAWSPVWSFVPSIPSNILRISGNKTGAFCAQQSVCRLITAPAWKFRERGVKLSWRFMEMNIIWTSEGSEKVAFILSATQRRQYRLKKGDGRD